MCEPLSVGVYACSEKVNVEEGSKVVIFGAGPIGENTINSYLILFYYNISFLMYI
jgi:threonine dehydrogenase-like Zn-dependent dehydrogenase